MSSLAPTTPSPISLNSDFPKTETDIDSLRQRIVEETAGQPHLPGIREFNGLNLRTLIEQFGGDLGAARLLDIGASIHGFALDEADRLGIHQYVGIDLDVARKWGSNVVSITNDERVHFLCQMDAHRLWFEDNTADLILCLSGFEHYLYPEIVINEILRVLKPGGIALINYEPIWTCSYGHHLHHFGIGEETVPPWSHLIYDKSQMAELLQRSVWPKNCPISKGEALDWIYDGREINRRDCRFHRQLLESIPCSELKWLLPHPDQSTVVIEAAKLAASLLPYEEEELLTRGFACCFQK